MGDTDFRGIMDITIDGDCSGWSGVILTIVSGLAVFSTVARGVGPEVAVTALVGFPVLVRVLDTRVFAHKVQILKRKNNMHFGRKSVQTIRVENPSSKKFVCRERSLTGLVKVQKSQ